MYFIYILRCADDTFYTGITTDLARRFTEHKEGIGSRYTRSRGTVEIVYSEESPNRAEASRREAAIKKMSRSGKMGLFKQASKIKARDSL